MTAPVDRADGEPDSSSPAPRTRAARAPLAPQGRAGSPAGPQPPRSGPAGPTSPPPASTPIAPLAEGTPAPAGGASADRVPPAGQAARQAWKAALSAHHAALRRGRTTRAAPRTGPGMIRKPPPGDAA